MHDAISKGVGYMAWKWICISIDSWMVVLMESGTKTKPYKHVSQISCIGVSFLGVLNIHIPLYLGSRRKPFFWTSKFFCCLVPVSIILIRVSFVNCQIFISGHYWISILCCWHWLVQCYMASLWHLFQGSATWMRRCSATWMRRCILADGFFLFQLFSCGTSLSKFFLVGSNSHQTVSICLIHTWAIDFQEQGYMILYNQRQLFVYTNSHIQIVQSLLTIQLPHTNWYHHCLL